MALIKCKGCGQMVSTKAENCPKCGYSVRLSVEQGQEEAKQSVETHSITETEKKEVVNNEFQPQQKGNKKGIIIAVVVVVIIGCGVLFAMLNGNGNSGTNGQPQDTTAIADTETIKQDELASDSLAVAVEDTPNNYSTEITKDGIANIRLGKSFNDYNTSLMKQEDIDKQCFDFSIVDIQEKSEFEEVYYTMNMKLYKGQELLCTLFGGYFDKRPNTLQATVEAITVYSPQFRLPNGIHVGMSVKELISNYGATIQLHEGEGGENVESITLEIPNCRDFTFNVEKETLLNRYGEEYFNEYDSQSGTYKENFGDNIKNEVAELSDLESIVIRNNN